MRTRKPPIRSRVSAPDETRVFSATLNFRGYPADLELNVHGVAPADFDALPGKGQTCTSHGITSTWKKLKRGDIYITFFRAEVQDAGSAKAGGQ